MIYRPLPHGTYLDEVLFAAAFVVTIVLFIVMALADKRKASTEDHENRND